MLRKRVLTTCLAVVALVAGGCGSGEKPAAGPNPTTEALAYVSPRAPLVAVVSTDFDHGQGKAARELLERTPGGQALLDGLFEQLHLSYDRDVKPVLGHDVVVTAPDPAALHGHQLLLSTVAGHPDQLRKAAQGWKQIGVYRGAALYQRAPGIDAALRGSVLLMADNPDELRRALDLRARGGGLSPTALRERLGALPVGALVRVVGDARALRGAAPRHRDPFHLADLRWVKSFRRFAATASVVPAGLELRLHVAGDPRGIDSADVPFAPRGGSGPALAAGSAPLTAAIGDGAHFLAFLERAYGQVDSDDVGKLEAAKAIARIVAGVDVDRDIVQQVGPATLLSNDVRHFTFRADLKDPARVARALDKLEPIAARFLSVAKLYGFELDRAPGGTFLLRHDGQAYARFGVVDRALVFTTDAAANLEAVAKAKAAPITGPAPGAVVARLRASALRDFIVNAFHLPPLARLALVRLGDAAAAADAAPDHLDVTATVAIAR